MNAFDVCKLTRPTGKKWPRFGSILIEGFPYLECEVEYACKKEMNCSVIDFLTLRTRLAYLNKDAAIEVAPKVADLMAKVKADGLARVESTADAEEEWTAHVHLMAQRMLFSKTNSWFTGINSNLEGRDQRSVLLYAGGAPGYRDKCDEVAAAGYAGMVLR